MELGPEFMERMGTLENAPLYLGYRMTRTGPENGYRNEYAIMLRQKDLQMEKAP
jgi:hypothetical protein